MRVIYLLLSFMLCFYPVTQAQNTTNQFMTQAQSSLEKKDYTKARYLLITKLLQKREMRKDIVIELSYKGFSRASDYS